MLKNAYLQRVYDEVVARDPHKPEFLQAVYEVLESLEPVIEQNPKFEKYGVIERMVEPEREVPGTRDNT